MKYLSEQAFGKLNLTLDILGRRPDGYHDLEMVMVSVSLADKLHLILDTGRPWAVACDDPDLPRDRDNLCWRAAELYFDAAGFSPDGLMIHIEKQIPAQAGMAGGSSDAAAVLRALNRYYRRFDKIRLRELGLQIGSDVPYCLFGGTALARGRGELLTRLPKLPEKLFFVLVKPDFSVSTPALFRQIDETGVTARPDTPAMVEAIRAGDPTAIGSLLQNAFEPAVSEAWPVVQEIRTALLEVGALGARLTGTGSVVFGLFSSRNKAARAALALEKRYAEVHIVTSV